MLRGELARLASLHASLTRRARRSTCGCPDAVLNLGAALAPYATLQPDLLELGRFVDDSVRETISVTHRKLADDLELLENLNDSNPDSGDTRLLAEVLGDRILELLEREERAIFAPLLRLSAASGGQPTDGGTDRETTPPKEAPK